MSDDPGVEVTVLPYIYVTDLATAAAAGASVVTPPYPEGSLRIATISDPAGNVIGIWADEGRP
jgi:predicted enzyme related to lactoylglutathione lyase